MSKDRQNVSAGTELQQATAAPRTWDSVGGKPEPSPGVMELTPEDISVPQSVRSRGSGLVPEEITDIETLDIRGARTNAKVSSAAKTKMLQNATNAAAKRFQANYKVDPENPEGTKLVWIRAMKSHHPAPCVGNFHFQNVYTHFVEGIRYLVPHYVGQSLESGDNAIVL
jgi:hypothetical protein